MKKTAAAAILAAGVLLSAGALTGPHLDSHPHSVASAAALAQKIYTGDMLSSCIDAIAGGNYTVEGECFSYAYYYGTLDALKPYTKFVNGNNTTDKLEGNKTLANRWASSATLGESTIIKLTARRDISLQITSDSDASHNNYIHYSPDTYFEYIAEGEADNGKRYRISMHRQYALVDAAENSYAFSLSMKEGDSFYLLFGSDFVTPSPKSLSRWLTFSATEDYKEEDRPDFNSMPRILELRADRLSKLEAQALTVSAENGYSTASVNAAAATLADAPRCMQRASTEAEVEAVYQALLLSLNNAKRLTVTKAELASVVSALCDRFDELCASIDPVRYAPVYDETQAYYYEGLQKILTANTPTRANYQYSYYENKILNLIYACDGGFGK